MSIIAALLPAPQDEGKSLDYVAVIKVPGNTKMIVRQGQGRFSHRLGLQRTQRHRLSPFHSFQYCPRQKNNEEQSPGSREVSQCQPGCRPGQARGHSDATFAAMGAAALVLRSLELRTRV